MQALATLTKQLFRAYLEGKNSPKCACVDLSAKPFSRIRRSVGLEAGADPGAVWMYSVHISVVA